jgi:NAD(P)-dependent dehydrogenase (short-subunit alcohol dehydrogenase family)
MSLITRLSALRRAPTRIRTIIERNLQKSITTTTSHLSPTSKIEQSKAKSFADLRQITEKKQNFSAKPLNDKPDWILAPDHSSVQERLGSCKGKVAVVTGGARGIGAQVALGLAEAGAKVAILDILKKPDASDFEPIIRACPETKYYQTDISSAEEVTAAFKNIVSDFGSVDICVAAAGVIREKSFVEVTPEELMFQVNVNMVGMYYTSQQAAKQMISQGRGGSILVIASMASHRALRDQEASCYVMTKWAVRGWVKQVAMELGKHGIRVNSLSPGYTQTTMTLPLFSPERIASWPYVSVLDRMGRADELKAPAVFLCSDASSYITGTDLLNDGGVTCW